jgi:Tol biopolymer transport system component
VIIGTPHYVSPEQAAGDRELDARSDVYSLGVVVYEMLAGGSLFGGDSAGDTLAAVLRAEIDFSRLPEGTPPAVRRLLRRCLERDRKNRLHDIADARLVLEELLAGKHDEPARSDVGVARSIVRRWSWRHSAIAFGAGLVVGLAAAALWLGRPAGEIPAPVLTQFEIRPDGMVFGRGLAISPDGRKIVFVARDQSGRTALWLRSLDRLEPRKLPETDDAYLPFWAPDSRRIGYFSQRSLKWIDSVAGTPTEIATTSSAQDVRGGAWGADDVVLYAPSFSGPMLAVSARGGASQPATRLPEDGSIGTTRFPSFLPDGRRFVFFASPAAGTEPGTLYLGRLGSLEAKLLGPATSTAVYAPPGYLLYARGDALVAHRFDDRREELVGDAVPLGVPGGGSISVAGLRSLGVSANGTLAYRADRLSATQIVWVDREGKLLEAVTGAETIWHYAPRLSPDGRSMAVAQYQARGKLGEIWVHDLARKVANRITLEEGDSFVALWTRPDGREILYNSARAGVTGAIFRHALERPGEERLWLAGGVYQIPASATPDGRRILVERADAQGRVGLWIRDLEGEAEAQRLSPANFAEFSGDISPDGRWLVYLSDVTREWEVYVRRLDGSGGAIRISTGGGSQPVWRRDGRELFYLDTLGRIVSVPVAGGERLEIGAPRALFLAQLEDASDRQYDVSADGQRFLLNRSLGAGDSPLVVVLDWTALLAQRAP